MVDNERSGLEHSIESGRVAKLFGRVMDFPVASVGIIFLMTLLALGGYFYPNWPADLKARFTKAKPPESATQFESPRVANNIPKSRRVLRQSFGESQGVLIIDTPDLFSIEGAAAYRSVVKAIRDLDVVDSARSLDETPPLNIFGLAEPILPIGHASPQRFAASKEKALKHPLVVGILLSPNARTTLVEINYDFVFVQEDSDLTTKLIEEAKKAASAYPTIKMDFQVTGQLPFRRMLQRNNRSNEIKYQLIGYGMIIGMAALLFRGFSVVCVVSAAPIAGVAWCLGLLRYFGLEDNPFSFVILPVLLSLVGFTDGVHMMVHIRTLLQSGLKPFDACRRALELVGMACFLTSLTTAIGMGSLIFAHHEIVREFGISCVIGVTSTWISVLLIIPLACRTRIGNRLRRSTNRDYLDRWVDHIGPMVGFMVRHARAATVVIGILFIVTAWITSGLRPDDQRSSAIPAGSDIRRSLDYLDKTMGGLDVCGLQVHWSEAKNKSHEVIVATLQELDETLRQEPLIGHPLSLPRLLEAMPGEGTAIDKLSLVELLPPPLKLSLFDPDNYRATLYFRCMDLGSATYAETFERIESRIDAILLRQPEMTIYMTGDPIWRWRNLYRIVTDLTMSLGSACVIISLVMAIAYRSIRIGIISIIPNMLPLLASGSWLALTGQPLEIVSVCCFTICLGIAVDDTIHFLSRYQDVRRITPNIDQAIEQSFQAVGTGMLMTTIVLCAGFSTVLSNETKDFRVFSALGIITLFVALLCDVFFLPALLKTFDREVTTKVPSSELD